jgi:hypothetical protein
MSRERNRSEWRIGRLIDVFQIRLQDHDPISGKLAFEAGIMVHGGGLARRRQAPRYE